MSVCLFICLFVVVLSIGTGRPNERDDDCDNVGRVAICNYMFGADDVSRVKLRNKTTEDQGKG